jgi:Membrane bound O-acyl transferase family
MTPALRLLLASAGLLAVLKLLVLARRPTFPGPVGLCAFLFVWPGIIPEAFRKRQPSQIIEAAAYLSAWARMVLGLVSILLLAIYAPRIPEPALGAAGIAALLLAAHLGIGCLLPWWMRGAGFRVHLLFDRPWAATSLADFWSRRWNLVFVEMNQRLFLRPLCRTVGRRGARFVLFGISGLLHEVAISFPAGAGFGLPLSYFLLQGALVEIEERFRIRSRLWTWYWLLAPAPLVFHSPFRAQLVVPLYWWLHSLLFAHPWAWYLSGAIYAAALGHLLLLCASGQVANRLGWKQDIPKLTRFNQKVFWVYAFYILLCICTFATLTWRLHDHFLAGEESARWIAGFIAVFWTVRVLVDVFWYDHRDWPTGNSLLAGHALLTTLFCALASLYWVIVIAPGV